MSSSIQELGAEYVLSAKYDVQKSEGTLKASEQAQADLKQLIKTLESKGFASDIRPGDGSSVLVFVRLLSEKLQELEEKDLLRNYEFGVTAKNTTTEGRLRLVNEYLTSPESMGGAGITPGEGDWKFVISVFPVTKELDHSLLGQDLKSHVVSPNLSTANIKETFGVKVALYFEFLKYFIFWLTPLSVLGVISFLKSKGRYSLSFTILNLVWGVSFIGFWNKRQRYLVNFWGVQNIHSVQKNYSKLVEINEDLEEKATKGPSDDNDGVRFLKEIGFVPIAFSFTAVLVGCQLACFVLEIFLSEVYDGPGSAYLPLISTILISVIVPVLTLVFNIVTDTVSAWENHPTSYNLKKSKLIKTFVLNFLTSYVPLIITSFIYLPFAHLIQPNLGNIQSKISSNLREDRFYYKYLTNLKKQENFKINQERLNGQFYYFVVTNQVISIVVKYALPLILAKAKPFIMSLISKKQERVEVEDDPKEKKWLDSIRNASALPVYNVDDDFRGIVLLFGYLIMFGSVWSIAPSVTLVFLVLTFKLDTFKLSSGKYYRPPVPEQVDSIQPWNYILVFLVWSGSIISPMITMFYRHGTKPPKSMGQLSLENASVNVSSTTKLAATVFIAEHLVVILTLVFSKSLSYFKSDKEKENDFIENDIKLRRDHYTGKVKSSIKPHDDGLWSKINSSDVLEKVDGVPSQLKVNNAKNVSTDEKTNPAIASEVAGSSATFSSSVQRSDADPTESVIKQKKSILSDKEDELNGLKSNLSTSPSDELRKVAEKSDSIIESKNSKGDLTYSTIDNNDHIDEDVSDVLKTGSEDSPSKKTSPSKVVSDKVESEVSGKESGNSVSDEKLRAKNGSNGSSDKSAKKKSSLKKIFKNSK